MRIDMNYTKEVMRELLSINSPAGDTTLAMNKINDYFSELDIEVNWTNKGAIIGVISGQDTKNQKMVSAHVDTLGAMVKGIKPNGRLKLSNIGEFSWGSVEGENVVITTNEDKKYTGTILPTKTSVDILEEIPREIKRTEDTMEVRIDERTSTKEETEALGISVGDFVSFDSRTIFTDNGYIKSRHLDDKASIAILLAICKYFKDNSIKPKNTLLLYISNCKEIGHGISVVPEKVNEFISLDVGTAKGEHNSHEHSVTIIAKDRVTPYSSIIKKELVAIAKREAIDYKIDINNRYVSDASTAVVQGGDFEIACLGPGVDATHHYERTHIDSIENTIKLLISYLS